MAIGQMACNLFMRTIDDRHLAFHEPLQGGIAKTACQREDMVDTFFVQRPGEQVSPRECVLVQS